MSLADEMAVIIVDSSSIDFSLQGDWKKGGIEGESTLWWWPYLNTTWDSVDRLGNFTLTFEGFDATIVGGGPLPPYSTYPDSIITIDPDASDALSVPVIASNDPPYYLPWYKTPPLAYGAHRLQMTHCVQILLDYALITV
ncbi:hypothetical protein CVT24_010603, partial [Panaeolus cyanescens]